MAKLTDNSPMPFGKHRGKRMEDVPANYLLWLWNEGNISDPDVSAYIQESMSALTLECPDTEVRKAR